MASTVRTFVAIQLSEAILERLAETQALLKRGPGGGAGRWVRVEGVHLTLKFLGDTPLTKIAAVENALTECCQRWAPFDLALAGLGCFPNTHRPRVVWVGVREESGTLREMQAEIERMLSPLGFPPEGRRFSPHLTLARVDQRASARDVVQLGEQVARAQVGALGRLRVEAVHLIQSDLLPQGALYTPLHEARLLG